MGCSVVESVMSRLNVSTSMERSFLKDTVLWMGAGLMVAAVKFIAHFNTNKTVINTV